MSIPVSVLLKRYTISSCGCWEYTGRLVDGYGIVWADKKRKGIHRVSYEYHYGSTNGLYVLHKCDNRRCINPEHLFLGTQSDNSLDMWIKGRGVIQDTKGILNGQAKLNEEEVLEIRQLYTEGYSQREISEFFGVTRENIRSIVNRVSWRHL